VDPLHFGTVRIRIQILLYSSAADKMPTKKKIFFKVFLAYKLLKVPVHFASVFIHKK
jgi:hypothetical protein